MHFQTFLTRYLLLASQLLTAVTSAPAPATNTSAFPQSIRGNDTAADPDTTGYFINHVSLNVRNLDASIDFYERVFGLRLLFIFRFSPSFSIAYLGHSSGGKNGSAYQTNEELVRFKNNAQGMVEMQFFDDPATIGNLTASTEWPNTFSHIGVVVPDVTEAVARMERLGVKIVSRPGDVPVPGGPLTRALGVGQLSADHPEAEAVLGAFALLNRGLLFVEDPDGNLIEIQNLVEPVAF